MLIPLGGPRRTKRLVVALWEHTNFGGVKRTLIENVGDLNGWDFRKRANGSAVHPGPSFNMWISFIPAVTFLDEDPNVGSLTLGPGAWSDLSQFG